jgi:endo-1,4-beta-D-glucanase Y
MATTSSQLISHIATSTAHNIYNDFLPNVSADFRFSVFGELLLVIGVCILIPTIYRIFRQRHQPSSSSTRTTVLLLSGTIIIAGLVVLSIGTYFGSDSNRIPLTFSSGAMSASAWEAYKITYMEKGSTRTVDPDRDNITTSEGESYTMLRAVWLDDKDTFDKSWKWTSTNLKRPKDSLFSWKYGPHANGTYGILTEDGGNNTATDADSDIALSLVFAYSRWQDPAYLASARAIITDIWNNEVVMINGKPYLASNNLEKTATKDTIIVNPSYFAPYSYRIFAKIDPSHPWMALIDTSYTVLQTSMTDHLNTGTSANLVPDWIQINKTTGAISAVASSTTLTTDYSYDAMRAPWRMALDWQWNKEPRAKATLDYMTFLKDFWNQKGKIFADYAHTTAQHQMIMKHRQSTADQLDTLS